MKNTNDIKTTRRINIKAIVAGAVSLVVLSGIVAFLTVTTTGQAIVFAIQDPATVNHAADMKNEYVNSFELTSAPKE